MKSIEVKILNPEAIIDAEQVMQTAALLTQRGEKIGDTAEFMALHKRPLNKNLIKDLCTLPHPTLQKFGIINVVVVGLSRRALAQITRHQNEVKFMSSSLQYSNYEGKERFVIPPGLNQSAEKALTEFYSLAAKTYDTLIKAGATPDQAGYVMPQGLKGVLLISATPYQWKHMISQRTCNRNTDEVIYIFSEIYSRLNNIAPELFGDAGPGCSKPTGCQEGRMSCKKANKEPEKPETKAQSAPKHEKKPRLRSFLSKSNK